MKFSSPLGVGLVPSKPLICISRIIFSSPSGDGLVLKNEKNKCKNLKIFVPAWGWVGSIFSPCKNQLVYVFSSPSGDGLVLKEYTLNENLYNIFVPEWGWVVSER